MTRLVYSEIKSQLPFNLYAHEAASNAVAKSMLMRLENDMAAWSETAAKQKQPEVASLMEDVIKRYFAPDAGQ